MTDDFSDALYFSYGKTSGLSLPGTTSLARSSLPWLAAEVGRFYRPIKKQITIRIDADLLDWFKHEAEKYQTLINQACREYMLHHAKKKTKIGPKIKVN